MRPRFSTALVLGIVVAAGVSGWRRVAHARRAASAAAVVSAAVAHGDPVLHVPHAGGAITLDGDTDDPGWLRAPGPTRTGDFVMRDGRPARPYSDTRIVWSGDYLYLSLYASDEDIESHVDQPDMPSGDEDFFHVVFTQPGVEYAIDATPRAILADSIRVNGGAWDRAWTSGAHASREIDGILNDPSHTDEEWAIELAVPFSALGMRGERGETIGLSISRCDSPKHGPRTCAGWGDDPARRGRIVLD